MLASAALGVWAAVAPAEPGLQLRWEAPQGCPTEAEVRARVVRRVGEEAARTARLTARGTVTQADGKWRLALELSGETGGGQRSLTAGRCEELAEAGALVIAIAVDPRAGLAGEGVVPAPPDGESGTGPDGQGAPDMSGEIGPPGQDGKDTGGGAVGQGAPGTGGGTVGHGAPGTGAGAGENGAGGRGVVDGAGPGGQDGLPLEAPGEENAETGAKGQARKGMLRVGVRAAGGVGFARILPGTGAATSLSVSLAGRGWRVELGGLYLPPVPGGTAEIGGRFQLGAGWLRGCPAWTRGKFEVPVCLGLQVGAIRGRGLGSGLVIEQTAHALWTAATLGAALAWRPRERIALWLQADAIVALTRPQFVTAGGALVHESARFGGHVLAGIEFRVR